MKTITENPLKKSNLFVTPDSIAELMAVVDDMEKNALFASIMTWNLASKLVDEAIDESEQDIDEMELKTYECKDCGSRNLRRVCDAVWDIDEQKWIVKLVDEKATCKNCGLFDVPRKVTL